jgi:hypothetical protein
MEKELTCSITLQPLKEPFVTNCGHTFERSAIKKHLIKNQSCPICREKITSLCKNWILVSDSAKEEKPAPKKRKSAHELATVLKKKKRLENDGANEIFDYIDDMLEKAASAGEHIIDVDLSELSRLDSFEICGVIQKEYHGRGFDTISKRNKISVSFQIMTSNK